MFSLFFKPQMPCHLLQEALRERIHQPAEFLPSLHFGRAYCLCHSLVPSAVSNLNSQSLSFLVCEMEVLVPSSQGTLSIN